VAAEDDTPGGGGSTTRFSDDGAIRNLKSEGGKSNPPIQEQRHAAASVVTSESPAVHNVPAAGCLPIVSCPCPRAAFAFKSCRRGPTATDESRAAAVVGEAEGPDVFLLSNQRPSGM